ncbi:sialate O-acetylesterase [Altererythrobacter aurantiacus]|uniref:Sialate O-acetylesterase n=1 Tax=Parapontixanthobacter aurantiacus TaxID=1463599 RepID=A0A844ZFV5_9SPHN|nr:sialate O-acetylesterase [Parapontixanthobacter aurantiacus]MXO85847.1 sialate O-acetylesterase [Parapontixanthobacter aurantiacus]
MRLGLITLALSLPASAMAAPVLGPGYGDGMVLQRGEPIVLEGRTLPGESVTAEIADESATVRANDDGIFRVTLPAQPASAAGMRLVLKDGTGETRYDNMLIGDVVLCSGQSNMELSVNRALDSYNQLRVAADDGIRLFKVPKTTAPVPADRFAETLSWTTANGETVAEFSAACFYMGKHLRSLRPDVPVGLIHSNWGGSAARAWFTPEGVVAMEGAETLQLLQSYDADPLAATRSFAPRWKEWWKSQDDGREPWLDYDSLEWSPIPKFSFWNEWEGTGLDEEPRANVWLRQTVTLTKEQAEQDGALSIGAIDDLDMTFVNGEPVGYSFGWGVERTYRVPADLLRAGKNEILIAANNMWDTGGFFGGPDRLFFTPGNGDVPVPLGADWEYSIADVEGAPPRAPWDANAGAGVMHNAMIAPLGPMRLVAVAWYQGESDVGQPDYDSKLATLFAGWREQFGPQAKMLVVQLADFGERSAKPVESGWAQLRQEQLAAVQADENADLVTAIDIGEPSDIHPANKNVLGVRLAQALAGQAMPKPSSARREGNLVIVRFQDLEGDLVAYSGPTALGVELCGEVQDNCRFVSPRLDGQRLLIDLPAGAAASRVRYAWSDAPIVNFYDGNNRPIPGFELQIEE